MIAASPLPFSNVRVHFASMRIARVSCCWQVYQLGLSDIGGNIPKTVNLLGLFPANFNFAMLNIPGIHLVTIFNNEKSQIQLR